MLKLISKFFLENKSNQTIIYTSAVAILGNRRELIFKVTGHSLEACLQAEEGDGAQLHVCTKGRKSQQTASTALKISRNTKLFGAQNQWEEQTWKEFVLHLETKLSTLSCKFKTR